MTKNIQGADGSAASIGMYYLGNPTRLAPTPKPAPCLAEMPIEGANRSRRLKVAAATNPISTTSSMFFFLDGKLNATVDTTRPSSRYFKILIITSTASNLAGIFIIPGDIFSSVLYI